MSLTILMLEKVHMTTTSLRSGSNLWSGTCLLGIRFTTNEEVSRPKTQTIEIPNQWPSSDQVETRTVLIVSKYGPKTSTEVWKAVKVIKKVRRTSYRFQLLTWMNIHPVFHVSSLKRYHINDDDHRCNEVTRSPIMMKDTSQKEVEEILVEKTRHIANQRRNGQEFLIMWKRLSEEKIRWERQWPEVIRTSNYYVWRNETVYRDVNQLSEGGCHGHVCPRRVVHGCMPVACQTPYVVSLSCFPLLLLWCTISYWIFRVWRFNKIML